MEAWSSSEGAARASALLGSTWSTSPRSLTSAPGNLTIIGDYTDLGDGVGLPTVTPHRAYAAASPRRDDVVRIVLEAPASSVTEARTWEGSLASIDEAMADTGWHTHIASVLWSLIERGYSGPGMDIAISTCVPFGSGLSAMSALTVATARAVNDLWGLSLTHADRALELVDVCIDAENGIQRWGTAGLVQHSLIRCSDGEALYLDFSTRPASATPCPLYFPDYGLGLLIMTTAEPPGRIGDVVQARMAEIGAATTTLGVKSLRELQDAPEGLARIESLADQVLRRRARHVLTENERVDLVRDELSGTAPAHERFVAVGKAMYRSHASLEMDFEVSSAELNLAVDTAFRLGALGARMVGPGCGGSAVALVRRAAARATAQAVTAEFAAAGASPPSFALV